MLPRLLTREEIISYSSESSLAAGIWVNAWSHKPDHEVGDASISAVASRSDHKQRELCGHGHKTEVDQNQIPEISTTIKMDKTLFTDSFIDY